MKQQGVGELFAFVTRGAIIESRHTAHIVVCSDDRLLHSVGEPELLNPLRSTAKPLIAESSLPMLASILDDEKLALICSSHNGEPQHVRRLRHILHQEGLAEDVLRLGNHAPIVPGLQYESPPQTITLFDPLWNTLFDPLRNNCSGKHVGLLLLARALGQDPTTYSDPTGKALRYVESHIKSLAECTGSPAIPLIDGCGLTTFAITLTALARIYARFYSKTISHELATIRAALLSNPKLIGGSRRATTALLHHGVLAKDGFDGLFALAFQGRDGIPCGVAIKVDSGSDAIAQALAMTAAELITQQKLNAANVYPGFHINNHLGRRTGEIQVREDLLRDLLEPLTSG